MALRSLPACFAWMLCVACWIAPALGQDFESLLAKAPSDANLVVMVNADKIYASEAGQAGGWRQKYQSRFAAAPLRMPPDAKQYVLAASIDLATLTPTRETAITRIGTDLSMPMVQRLVGGSLDEIAGREAVATPSSGHIIKLGPSEFAIVHPSDRQSTDRWLRAVIDRDKPALSPYLAHAAQYPDRVGTEFIMAFDLTGAVGQSVVRKALGGSKVLTEKGIDLDQAAAVLASVRGLTLGARVTDHVSGSLKVEFDQPVALLAPVAKPLMLEVLAEAGATIDEFNDWKPQTDDRSMRLSGELTASGLRRIFSLFELDGTILDKAADAEEGNPSEDRYAVTPEATLAYFQGIEEHLKDLSREHGASSYYTMGRWFDKYAKRIDRMPILKVDPELVEFGSQVVGQLRDCVDAIKGSGIRSEARGASVEPAYDNYPVFVGSNYASGVQDDMRQVESQRRAIRAGEQAQSSTTVRGVVRQLEDGMSSVRRRMTQKYQVEF